MTTTKTKLKVRSDSKSVLGSPKEDSSASTRALFYSLVSETSAKTVSLFGGKLSIDIKAPTVAQIAKYESSSMANIPENATEDLSKYRSILTANRAISVIYLFINCAYEPGTNELVFEETDFDILNGMPAIEWERIRLVLFPETTDNDVAKDTKKN